MARKTQIMVGVNPEQAEWLDQKAQEGWKKSALMRFLIDECMRHEETNENPIKIRKAAPIRLPIKKQSKQSKPHVTRSLKLKIPKGTPGKSTARITRKESHVKVDLLDMNIEGELVSWFYNHPGEPLPEYLSKKRLQYFVDLYNKTHQY